LCNADAWLARSCARLLALLPICLSLFAPASVRADIYKWTDERGNTVVSNLQPVDPSMVSGVELIATAVKPSAQYPAPPSQQAGTPTEQALAARIEDLERQVQAQQYAQQQQGDPNADYSGGYYPAPPPPDPGYYGSYDPGYYGGYDSGFYPSDYYPYYPWPLSYSVIVAPASRFGHRHEFMNRHEFSHRPPGSANRPAAFAGRSAAPASRSTAFASRPTAFAGRPASFATRPASFATRPSSVGVSRGASFGGGSMHRGR
jgi:hypothetical protein